MSRKLTVHRLLAENDIQGLAEALDPEKIDGAVVVTLKRDSQIHQNETRKMQEIRGIQEKLIRESTNSKLTKHLAHLIDVEQSRLSMAAKD